MSALKRFPALLVSGALSCLLLASCASAGQTGGAASSAAPTSEAAGSAEAAQNAAGGASAAESEEAVSSGEAAQGAAVSSPEENGAFSLTDISGRESHFDKRPETIAVANYIFNFLLVGGRDSLSSVVVLTKDGWEDTRYGEYTALTEAYPEIEDIPSIGGYHDDVLNSERILELNPDCILINRSQYTENETSIPVWEAAGIRVIVLDYHKMSLENDVQSTEILGKLLGREETAKELNDSYTNGIQMVEDRVSALPDSEKNVKAYVELGNLGPGPIGNSYDGILWGAILDNIGAANLAKGKLGEGYGALDQEYIVDQNPEKIIIGGSIWTGDTESSQMRMGFTVSESEAQERLRPFCERAWWQGVNAVKNGEIYGVDHGSLRNALDYTFTEYLAKIVYPDAFSDLDPQEEYEKMLKKYLPEITEPGTFMIKLNETAN